MLKSGIPIRSGPTTLTCSSFAGSPAPPCPTSRSTRPDAPKSAGAPGGDRFAGRQVEHRAQQLLVAARPLFARRQAADHLRRLASDCPDRGRPRPDDKWSNCSFVSVVCIASLRASSKRSNIAESVDNGRLEPTAADASAMFDRFGIDARSEALQTTLTNEQLDHVSTGPVDLDLGSPADAPGMIQNLAPSERNAPADELSGLTLYLFDRRENASSFSAAPAHYPGGPWSTSRSATTTRAAATSDDDTIKVVARCASAFRCTTSTSTRRTSCRAVS